MKYIWNIKKEKDPGNKAVTNEKNIIQEADIEV